jgi:stage V sporulation protein AB
MMGKLLSGVTGFSAGFIVAGGVVAMMVGLGIITRFVGISHTAAHVKGYEDAILLGALAGNILTTFDISVPIGAWILALGGIFTGVFVGGWILALAEIINVFPVYCRRLGITKGLSWIVVSMAIGKTAGSLLLFYMRWGKG